jgi:hypothetical protein
MMIRQGCIAKKKKKKRKDSAGSDVTASMIKGGVT